MPATRPRRCVPIPPMALPRVDADHVLITRAEPAAHRTADAVRARGWQPVIAPLLAIASVPTTVPDQDWAAVVLTSANALPAAAPFWHLPLYTVGDATAEAARAAGHGNVRSAGGDVHALARLLTMRPPDGPLLHLSGEHVAADLAELLMDTDIVVHRHVVYRAVAAAALPADVPALIAGGQLAAALFFSPRGAATFAQLAAGLNVRAVRALCISANVATALGDLSFARVDAAAAPTQDDLLALLEVRV